jgi:chitin deacetylase
MGRVKRRVVLSLAIFTALIACGVALFFISKARSFQFFGEIASAVPNDGKRIALTFDDGPTENTAAILERLEALDVKATFFVCGADAQKRPDDAQAIAQAGHALGNHSYSHQRMVLKSYSFVKEEVDRTNELIRESGYEGEIFFRPPYGKKLFALPFYLDRIGMATAMWSVEPETYLGFDAAPEAIAQYMIDNVESGSIILLHPMYNPDRVLAALDIAVPALKDQGYAFCTVPELYGAGEAEASYVPDIDCGGRRGHRGRDEKADRGVGACRAHCGGLPGDRPGV